MSKGLLLVLTALALARPAFCDVRSGFKPIARPAARSAPVFGFHPLPAAQHAALRGFLISYRGQVGAKPAFLSALELDQVDLAPVAEVLRRHGIDLDSFSRMTLQQQHSLVSSRLPLGYVVSDAVELVAAKANATAIKARLAAVMIASPLIHEEDRYSAEQMLSTVSEELAQAWRAFGAFSDDGAAKQGEVPQGAPALREAAELSRQWLKLVNAGDIAGLAGALGIEAASKPPTGASASGRKPDLPAALPAQLSPRTNAEVQRRLPPGALADNGSFEYRAKIELPSGETRDALAPLATKGAAELFVATGRYMPPTGFISSIAGVLRRAKIELAVANRNYPGTAFIASTAAAAFSVAVAYKWGIALAAVPLLTMFWIVAKGLFRRHPIATVVNVAAIGGLSILLPHVGPWVALGSVLVSAFIAHSSFKRHWSAVGALLNAAFFAAALGWLHFAPAAKPADAHPSYQNDFTLPGNDLSFF